MINTAPVISDEVKFSFNKILEAIIPTTGINNAKGVTEAAEYVLSNHPQMENANNVEI